MLQSSAQSVSYGPELYDKIAESGAHKASLSAWRIALLGVIAGCYVSFGAWLAVTVGGNVPDLVSANPGLQKMLYGIFGYPMGLTLVAILGGELFTSNTAFGKGKPPLAGTLPARPLSTRGANHPFIAVAAAVYEGKTTLLQLAKSWSISFATNFVGCGLMVSILVAGGLITPALHEWPVALAIEKTHHTFLETVVRGMACNWLVCAAMALSTAATSMGGKFVGARTLSSTSRDDTDRIRSKTFFARIPAGIFLPNSAFASLGLEHCVANMFLLQLAMAAGAPLTWGEILFNNIFPAALGNVIGGAVCLAVPYALAYGRMGTRVDRWIRSHHAAAAAH